jgi:orotate phosphoribosyltransferase/AMMECR1 domain-containing protein
VRTVRRATAAEPVVTVDGAPAPWALDCLRATLNHDGATLAARALAPRLATFYGRQLATYGVGGIPLLQSCLMRDRRLRGLVIRKERRTYGARTQIEGDVDRREPVVLVDDASASGWSLVHAYELLEEHGLFVEGAVCLVRFGFNAGIAYLTDRGVRVESVLDLWGDLAGHLPGTAPVDANPTAALPPVRSARARFPSGLHPATLARRVIEARLAARPVPLPPRALGGGRWDARGGVFVSVRPQDDVTDRFAREGFFRFPDDDNRLPADAPRAVVLAALKTADALRTSKDGQANMIAGIAIAVTFCGPLERTTLGGVDNERFGLVARSLVRRGFLGGALPRMPGIAGDWEQHRHAHTTNAKLYRREPYELFRHEVIRAVEPGMPWHATGVPREKTPWHALHGPRIAKRARAAVLGIEPARLGFAAPASLDSLYVTVLVGGRVRGCSGGIVRDLDDDVVRHARTAAVDARFGVGPPAHRPHDEAVAVSVSFLSEPVPLGTITAEDAALRLRAGRDAILVEAATQDVERAALLLPMVASHSCLDEIAFCEAALEKAGLARDEPARFTRLACTSYGADGARTGALEGALPAPPRRRPLGRPAAESIARYLERAQREDGTFHLDHLPAIGARFGVAELPRMAHAAWVLARAQRSRAAARTLRALRSLVERDSACAWLRDPAGTRGTQSPPYQESFFLLALCEAGRPPALASALAATLAAAFDETGRVRTRSPGDDDALDLFAPQALLALGRARSCGVAGADDDRVRRAWIAAHIRFRHRPTIVQVAWLAQAALAWRRSKRLQDVTRAVVDDVVQFVLDRQQQSGAVLHPPTPAPLGFTTVLALEALAAARAMARRPARARIDDACRRALAFLDRLVIQERDVPWLADGAGALGGVRESLLDVRLRTDYAQHALAALLSLGAK